MSFAPDTHPRSTQALFRRMERYLREILTRYPKPTRFTTTGLKPSSFLLNIRDAINAYLHEDCRWTSNIDRDALKICRTNIRFRIELPNTVHCYIAGQAPGSSLAEMTLSGDNRLIDGTDEDVVKAFALLKARGYLNDAILLLCPSVALIDFLESSYPNLLLTQEKDDRWSLT